jgi:hypothetical protein
MTDELVEVIKRDVREIVESELRKFLERYEECEIVDYIPSSWCWSNVDVSFSMVIHSLPCDVTVYSTSTGKMMEIDCHVEYEDETDIYDLGWVVIRWKDNRCLADWHIRDKDIEKVARKIALEVETEDLRDVLEVLDVERIVRHVREDRES